jgi:hypothetical protein
LLEKHPVIAGKRLPVVVLVLEDHHRNRLGKGGTNAPGPSVPTTETLAGDDVAVPPDEPLRLAHGITSTVTIIVPGRSGLGSIDLLIEAIEPGVAHRGHRGPDQRVPSVNVVIEAELLIEAIEALTCPSPRWSRWPDDHARGDVARPRRSRGRFRSSRSRTSHTRSKLVVLRPRSPFR